MLEAGLPFVFDFLAWAFWWQHHEEKNHGEFFANALRVWLLRDDAAARLAALTAAGIAPDRIYQSLARYTAALSDEIRAESKETASSMCAQLNDLAAELPMTRFRTRKKKRRALKALASQDQAYARALARTNPKIFKKRYPEIFRK